MTLAMRRFSSIALVLLAAGCGTTPPPAPVSAPAAQPRTGSIVGSTAAELATRFGQPVLTIREGQGLKLQYRGATCVLDTYLYPPESGSGQPRVTHVDARSREGAPVASSACVSSLQAR